MRLYKDDSELANLVRTAYPYTRNIDYKGSTILVMSSEKLTFEEAMAYVKRGYDEKFNKYLKEIAIHIDGDHVDISYGTDPMPGFGRIRRITGYLVGTLDRFNDAKKAEESERVKHGVDGKSKNN